MKCGISNFKTINKYSRCDAEFYLTGRSEKGQATPVDVEKAELALKQAEERLNLAKQSKQEADQRHEEMVRNGEVKPV